jgi:hypothetical protein
VIGVQRVLFRSLAATAPFIKWPFLAGTVAIVVLSADPRRAARAALGALALQAAVFTVVLGPGMWQDTVVAQLHSGRRGLDILKGVWGQAAWSLLGLIALAAAAVARRAALREPRLFRVLVGLAIAMLLTLATNVKEGTGLNILVPIETVLLALALSGAVVLLRAPTSPLAAAGAVLALAFTFAQTASLLASPRTATPFIFPSSERGAWGREASGAQIERLTASARRCAPGVAFSGPPFVAFLADRPMPADQPDQFLTSRSSTLADVRARIDADAPRCP